MYRRINFTCKRIADILISLTGLIFVSPILAITTVLIKTMMPGSVFFNQERIGKDLKPFVIFKFRTMIVDKEAEKSHDDTKDIERTPPLGRFLRRSKIDELPQLINVLIGNMSLVGPRPTFQEQVNLYTPQQMTRLNMRPGMTGLAQVNGNGTLSWDERIKYDIFYVENFSVWLDIQILIKTIAVIILGEARFERALSSDSKTIVQKAVQK